MIVLILVISRYAKGFVRALSLFVTMIIGYIIAAAVGLIDIGTVGQGGWVDGADRRFPTAGWSGRA